MASLRALRGASRSLAWKFSAGDGAPNNGGPLSILGALRTNQSLFVVIREL